MLRPGYFYTLVLIFMAGIIPAYAQDASKQDTSKQEIENVLKQAREKIVQELQQQAAKEKKFLDEHNRQIDTLKSLQQQVKALEKDIDQLKKVGQEQSDEILKNEKAISEKLGEYRNFFSTAGAMASVYNKTYISSYLRQADTGFGKSGEGQNDGLRKRFVFSNIEKFWIAQLEHLTAQSQIRKLSTNIIGADGKQKKTDVIQFGGFSAVGGNGYLEFVAKVGQFRELKRQPSISAPHKVDAITKYAKQEGPHALALDPTHGVLLGLLVETPDINERIEQAGLVGKIIIGLAITGLLLAIYQILNLSFVSMKMALQKNNLGKPSKNNPLGRILLSSQNVSHDGARTLERQLDEAVLTELPRLEWGLSFLKLLAAIAPLLGLLGTVVGMIVTFQAISLFGTGDPKILAGGISQALMTTVLGLIAAISLLLLHSFASGMSRRLIQVLEEQAAGLVAIESQRKPA